MMDASALKEFVQRFTPEQFRYSRKNYIGLSSEAMHFELGVSRTACYKWERGSRPGKASIEKLLARYGTELEHYRRDFHDQKL